MSMCGRPRKYATDSAKKRAQAELKRKSLMTCYGAVQVNKHNLLCFVVKNSEVTKI